MRGTPPIVPSDERTASSITRPGVPHPLQRVLAALDAGACRSVVDLAVACDLPAAEVHAALATLESVGRVRRVPLLAAACAPEGCGGCGARLGCPLTSSSGAATLESWRTVPRVGFVAAN